MKKTVLKLSLALAIPFAIASCNQSGVSEEANNGDTDSTEVSDSTNELAVEEEEIQEETVNTDSNEDVTSFEEGSWGYTLQQFLDSEETGSKNFALDQIVISEGEDSEEATEDELSTEAELQLDQLASLLISNPEVKAEVQGHSKEANNALGKATKKGWSKAKAFFIRKKLIARGVSEDQLRHEGYGDKTLLEGVDGKDNSQNRIEIQFTK